jgi:general secretion pathway protein K
MRSHLFSGHRKCRPHRQTWLGSVSHWRSSPGFALVAVIWSLGLISLLGVAVMVGARYRTKVTTSVSTTIAVAVAAESAVNIGLASVAGLAAFRDLEFPLRCLMPGGETATITIESEAGKVDLNTATPAVLTALFAALTRDQATGARIAGGVLALRNSGAEPPDTSASQKPATNGKAGGVGKDGKAGDLGKGGFVTILQLDQIDGISPQLFHKAMRFVTVRSKRPAPDAATASSAMRQLLDLEREGSAPTPGQSTLSELTVRADVSAPDGNRFIREALVSIGTDKEPPYVIREWRRGTPDPSPPAFRNGKESNARVSRKACFLVGQPSSNGS